MALIGLGSIGAPIAIELSRAGIGKISLTDFDYIEPGSVVRWPIGVSSAGLQKTLALQQFISRNYPFTKVQVSDYHFGLPRYESEASLQKALLQADLIIDATAEFGIHQFLSLYSKNRKIPFLLCYITPGGIGGLVACINPSKNMGCWSCLQTALYSTKSIPEPPLLANSETQPPGCAELTSVFPGFNATEIALQTVRMAVSALSSGQPGEYPKINWDVAIVKFLDDSGSAIPPAWNTYSLDRICEHCK